LHLQAARRKIWARLNRPARWVNGGARRTAKGAVDTQVEAVGRIHLIKGNAGNVETLANAIVTCDALNALNTLRAYRKFVKI